MLFDTARPRLLAWYKWTYIIFNKMPLCLLLYPRLWLVNCPVLGEITVEAVWTRRWHMAIPSALHRCKLPILVRNSNWYNLNSTFKHLCISVVRSSCSKPQFNRCELQGTSKPLLTKKKINKPIPQVTEGKWPITLSTFLEAAQNRSNRYCQLNIYED